MGARPVPAPLLVRPRCGLRAVAQRAVLARLRAHVIARVVGTGVGGRGCTAAQQCKAADKLEKHRLIIAFSTIISLH